MLPKTFSRVSYCVVAMILGLQSDGDDWSIAAEVVEPFAAVDFKSDIRPILSNRCFACHGPDENHVESGLRLDQFESATAPADSGARAIVPGMVDESELVRRILTTDESQRMPPPHFGARLTDTETNLIQSWIRSGAVYSKHWSFDRIQNVRVEPVPSATSFPKWQYSAIDALVLKKLTERGWTPSPEASREALLRRVTLDLTGLPPTLEEQAAYSTDRSDQAYEQWVDRLIASPAFGEHWGRKWLDLARYADSAGYADDPQRTIWAYRDWVIHALNEGKSYDEFTIEQLAGDLLSNPTDEQLLATAFHRNTLTNNEGGTNDEEFRNVAVVDRVNTTMSVWMGLTMGCAQCHNHKFDPISQKEYFQIFAILNQTEDADRGDESPVLQWFTQEQRRDKDDIKLRLEAIQSLLAATDVALLPEQKKWEQTLKSPLETLPLHASSLQSQSKSTFSQVEPNTIRVQSSDDNDTYTIAFPISQPSTLEGLAGFQIHTLPDPTLPNGGVGIGDGNFVLTNVSATLVPETSSTLAGRYVRVEMQGDNQILSLAEVQVFSEGTNIAISGKATQSSTDFGGDAGRAIDGKTSGIYADNSTTHSAISTSPWWEVDLGKRTSIEKISIWNRTDGSTEGRLAGAKVILLSEDRKPLWNAIIDAPKASHDYEIRAVATIPFKTVNADYSQDGFMAKNAIDADSKSGWAIGGSVDKPHTLSIAVDRDAWPKTLDPSISSATAWVLRLTMKFDSPYKKALLASFAVSLSTDARFEEKTGVPANMARLVQAEGPLSPADSEALHRYYVTQIAPGRQPLRVERDLLTKKLADIKPTTSAPIFRELPAERQRTTKIQLRGNYRVQGETVSPGLLSTFQTTKPGDASTPINRLQLAQWLLQPDNPLTARVLANRYWETLFGIGIVRTSEEFGSQGDLPTNPELLDCLATELIRSGWDTKKLIRSIVMSATYRQDSSVTAKRSEEDPENIHLSRGPRFRVTAEQVRDMALASADLLSHKLYGPPTRPPQPSMGLSAAFGSRTDWDTSKGEDRYRRGIYTQWRRSNPYPSMATFDAPNREVCVLKRDRTNTPLQALVTLNDPAYVEAAQGLARRIVLYELPNGKLEQRIERVYLLTLSRKPSAREAEAIGRLYNSTRESLLASPEQAMKLATDPLGPLPNGADPIELATWTTINNVILNLDEFLMTP